MIRSLSSKVTVTWITPCRRRDMSTTKLTLMRRGNNLRYRDNLESFQYNASLAITGAIRGTLKEKRYQQIGLELLQHRRFFSQSLHFLEDFQRSLSKLCL